MCRSVKITEGWRRDAWPKLDICYHCKWDKERRRCSQLQKRERGLEGEWVMIYLHQANCLVVHTWPRILKINNISFMKKVWQYKMKGNRGHVTPLTPSESSPRFFSLLGLLPVLIGIRLPFCEFGLEWPFDLGHWWGGRCSLRGDDMAQLLRYVEDSSGSAGLRSRLPFLPFTLLHGEGQGIGTGWEDGVLQRHGLYVCVFDCACVWLCEWVAC